MNEWLVGAGILAALLTIGLGAGLSAFALWRVAQGWRAARWPHTTGTVLSVGYWKSDEGDSRQVLVLYAYSIGDRVFEGTLIHPAYTGSPFESAHKGLEAVLVPGAQVWVYYRGDTPEASTLSVGFFSGTLAVVFGGLGCAAFGVGLLLLASAGEGARAGMLAAGFGFLSCWALTMLFALKGNWDFAAGITVEESATVE